MPSKLPMIGLRLPPELKAAAERAAAQDHRSLNNWILDLIIREVHPMTQKAQRVQPLGRLDLIDVDGSASPTTAKKVYLEIDTRDGALCIESRCQCDNAVPMSVWHGIVRRLGIQISTDGEALTSAINNGDIDGIVARIVSGSEVVWDGSNHVGSRNADAEAALEELQTWLDNQAGTLPDGAGLWDASDWLVDGALSVWDVTGRTITAQTTDEDLAAVAAALESAARQEGIVLYSTRDWLEQLRDDDC